MLAGKENGGSRVFKEGILEPAPCNGHVYNLKLFNSVQYVVFTGIRVL